MSLHNEELASVDGKRDQHVAQQLGQTIIAARAEIASGVVARAEAFKAIAERTRDAKAAMAEKFDVPAKDFWTVFTDNGIERKITLLYAAPNGLQKGNWYDIFNTDTENDYMVTVGDETQDTRSGMTFEVYDSMVLGLEAGRLIDASGNAVKSDTWLTGEAICGKSEQGEFAPMGTNDRAYHPTLVSGYAASDRENVDEMRTFRPSFVIYSEPTITA